MVPVNSGARIPPARSGVLTQPEDRVADLAPKRMRLRYAGACRVCGGAVAAGTWAIYLPAEKRVECEQCWNAADDEQADTPHEAVGEDGAVPDTVVIAEPARLPIESGSAGSSARREYDRRVAKREDRIRARHPKLGGLILALSDEPQSTTAWQRGAVGEEKLAQRLDTLSGEGVRLLHDRRIPGTRANIDHIAVAPSGVFVIDAKRYRGRPHLRVEGGILRVRVEKLMVGTRDCTKLVEGVAKQVRLVHDVVVALPTEAFVRGMLCFVEADWPLIGGAFAISDVDVLWPKKVAEKLLAPGNLAPDAVAEVHAVLARHFPPA